MGSLPDTTEKRKDGEIMMEMDCFDFGIIICADGSEIIDRSIKTPYESLTPIQMMEYSEMENKILYMEVLKRRAQRESEQKRKVLRSLLYRVSCLFGLV